MDASAETAEQAFDALVRRLHARGRLRVWSLIITVFGDAVVPRGGRISLGVLQEIMGRLRIEPGAVRTALSRLAADHWVTREKDGRNSFYRLAEEGRHAFDLATRKIYASGPPHWNGTWTVAVAPPGGNAADPVEIAALGFIHVASGVWLRPQTAEAPNAAAALSGMLVIHGESAAHPETLHMLWPSGEIAQAYRDFAAVYGRFHTVLEEAGSLAPLDAIAARTLLIHDWRRVVLRDPGLPAELLPGDWPGEAARALARAVYRALVPASEAWLDREGLPPPSEPATFARRFGG